MNLIKHDQFAMYPQCLTILKKVAFNIAREASYINILSGQKSIKNSHFDEFLKT